MPEELLRKRSGMVREDGDVDVQPGSDAEEMADKPKEMVDGISASVCGGKREGAQRHGEMAAVEPDGRTEERDGRGTRRGRRSPRQVGIAQRR